MAFIQESRLPIIVRKGKDMDQQKQKRENGGYLFRNADKRTDKQPDFRGKMNIGGKEWLVSGWTRTKDGEEMISLSLTDPATLPQRDGAAPAAGAARPSNASGPFAKPAGSAPAAGPAAPAANKSFQPPAGKAASGAGYEDLEDLDSLFSGLDDDK